MAVRQPLEVRYGRPFHLSIAMLGFGLVAFAGMYLLTAPPDAGLDKLRTENLVLIGASATALLYYALRSTMMLRNRIPQLAADRDGLRLRFGRDVLVPWQDIQWLRVRGIRPMVQIGLAPQHLAGLHLSIWNLDDYLTAVPGAPTAVGIRCSGLDTPARDIHDALAAWHRSAPQARR